MANLRQQLLKIQKRNYERNLQLVQESLGHNARVKKYEAEYQKYLRRYLEISSKSELIRQILQSDVVFHGDYHTLGQSQRSILRVLREVADKRELLLAMEMIHGEDQASLDKYMAGKLSEKKFLEQISYQEKWPFPWEHFKPILDFCRLNKIRVVGINCSTGENAQSLPERDLFAAQVIAREMIKYDQHLIYVVDGDFHISPNHLPRQLDKLCKHMGMEYSRTIVYQNAENLYWSLCRQGLEESHVLRIDGESFCIMNTMPANKIQSYLNWLEYSEEAYYPVTQEWDDEAYEGQGLTIEKMVEIICQLLKIDLNPEIFSQLEIYYAANLDFMDVVYDIPELHAYIPDIKNKMKREEGFLLDYFSGTTRKFLIYLPNTNINMASEEAMHFINVAMRGPLKYELPPFDQFYRVAVTECLGFFGSKLINEKRKAQTEASLKKIIGNLDEQENLSEDKKEMKAIARGMLGQLHSLRDKKSMLSFKSKFRADVESKYSVMLATQLGYVLGNKLYYAVKREKVPLDYIHSWMSSPLDLPGDSFKCFAEIYESVKKIARIVQD